MNQVIFSEIWNFLELNVNTMTLYKFKLTEDMQTHLNEPMISYKLTKPTLAIAIYKLKKC